MEFSILEMCATMGGTTLLGGMIFFIYRCDKKSTEDRLMKLIEEDQETRRENTRAITELTMLLKGLSIRK